MNLKERWSKPPPEPTPDHFVRPELTGTVIDMRFWRGWGNDLVMMELHEDGPPGCEAWGTTLGWHTPLPKVGDLLIWDKSHVVISKVKPMYDPPDMFKIWFLLHEGPEPVAHSEA